ncbi:MAG: LysM peptidoglycan-binding domain-containing protein [Caldilineaceae bacterium]
MLPAGLHPPLPPLRAADVQTRSPLPPTPTEPRPSAVNRRQLSLILLLNAFISLAIALLVVWIVEARRPDPEQLAAIAGVGALPSTPPADLLDLPPTATDVAPAGEAAAVASPAPLDQTDPVTGGEPAAQAVGEPEIYVVQAGDSLFGIAASLGVDVEALAEANNITNPDLLFSGQRLVVPGTAKVPTPTAAGTLGTTGLNIRTVNAPGSLPEEYVEIINDTDLSFNLQGWKIQRSGGPEYTFGDLLMFPGGNVRLYTGSGANSTIARFWAQEAPVWSSGAVVVLINAAGERVAELTVP